jgi:ribosomal subunit interface protein
VAEMKIRIRERNALVTEELRRHAMRRLAFALSRFGEEVDSVVVRFSDANGQDGDSQKCCQIDVGLGRKVSVTETDADLFVALDRAADRASRSVARALERGRNESRPRPWTDGRPKS